MKAVFFSVMAACCLLAAFLWSRRSPPAETQAPSSPSATQAAKRMPSSRTLSAAAPRATEAAPPSPAEQEEARQWISAYQAARTGAEKRNVVQALLRMNNAAAVEAFGRLVEGEPSEEGKAELLEDMLWIDGHDDAKLKWLGQAARSDQPQEVRVAALRVMVDLDTPEARQLLEWHAADPDPIVRNRALKTLRHLQGEAEPISGNP